jgi:alkanesulfonate monooxygenase SsuD/methylene tetrahydromethanopterin reductase-like flavin-dependent oxidoreductase (luciferase family)
MQQGISVPNVGDPRKVIELAMDAEDAGWDGFFVWDHVPTIYYRPGPTS